ncbi:unnamed protein product, partial [Gordionus sp. m RMFG-2023]
CPAQPKNEFATADDCATPTPNKKWRLAKQKHDFNLFPKFRYTRPHGNPFQE